MLKLRLRQELKSNQNPTGEAQLVLQTTLHSRSRSLRTADAEANPDVSRIETALEAQTQERCHSLNEIALIARSESRPNCRPTM